MDVDGNGTLEILVQTFGAGFYIYTVPGSQENMLLWPTARGNFLRDGRDAAGWKKFPAGMLQLLLQES